MRSVRLAAAAIALQLLMQVPAAAGPIEVARQDRVSGRLDEAERILTAALASDRNNFTALYERGLIDEARAVRAPAGPQRTRHYRNAIHWQVRALVVGTSSRIPVTLVHLALGTAHLGLGDLSTAQMHLDLARRNERQMDDTSRGRLYANLGYLHAMRGDNAGATRFFRQGALLGNEQARQNLRALYSEDHR